MYFFPLFLSSTGQWRRWCIRFKTKRKYSTLITARVTSLYKLHDDLRRQIGFSSAFLFLKTSGARYTFPEGTFLMINWKLLQPCHLPLVPTDLWMTISPLFLCICMFLGDHTAPRRLMSQSLFFFFSFFLLQGTMVDLLRALWAPEGKTTQRRMLIYTTAGAKKQAVKVFFFFFCSLSCLPHKVHRPSGSNFVSLKVLYVRILV